MTKSESSSEKIILSLQEGELTVYERARIIGSRALQIAQGAKPYMDFSQEELAQIKFNPIEMAKKEFEAGKIPITVKRNLPKDTTKVYVEK